MQDWKSIYYDQTRIDRSICIHIETTRLSNEHLVLLLTSSGQFTMQTADGRWLLYPTATTGYLSIRVDSRVYTNRARTLTVDTPLTLVSNTSAFIRYRTPERIFVTQRFSLVGQAVQFDLEFENADGATHTVGARYLFDTQVHTNDGSPLYAPPSGTVIHETDFPNPGFVTWRGYDRWPEPTLTSEGTLATRPSRIVFAWWPNAVTYEWDYTINPSQPFYTPGYTTSPISDSCVLIYFGEASLEPSGQRKVTTYYGRGQPSTDFSRQRLVQTFDRLRLATINSIKADLDAFSELQAKYHFTMRLDARDYLEAVWTIASLTITPSPALLGRLGSDVEVLTRLAETAQVVELGGDVANGLLDLLDDIPPSASEAAIKQEYIYPHFMNTVPLGFETPGVAGALMYVEQAYAAYLRQIPDPLPPGYPVEDAIQFMERQIAALEESTYSEAWVMSYASSMCTMGKLGVLQEQKRAMSQLAQQYEAAQNVSFGLTLSQVGIFVGAGVLKLVGVVGLPVTFGSSTVVIIPTESVLWGGAATIAAIPEILDIVPTITSLSNKGAMSSISLQAIAQLANNVKMRRAVFDSTGQWLAHLGSGAVSGYDRVAGIEAEVVDIVISNIAVSANGITGQGNGRVIINNSGSSPVTAVVYGDISAMINRNVVTVGLTASNATTILPGVQGTVEFPISLLPSTQIDGAGYTAQITVVLSDTRGNVEILGPFNAHFFVGTTEQLPVLAAQVHTRLSQGNLDAGQSRTVNYQYSATTQRGRLLLVFPEGSDQDLHLFDAQGNHVGVNYSTGQVETQISGVTYSGAQNNPEWMEIVTPGTGVFTLKVVSQDTRGGNWFDLTSISSPRLPPILAVPSRVAWSVRREHVGQNIRQSFGLLIGEGGGSQSLRDLQVGVSDLRGRSGRILPASLVSIDAPSVVPAGQGVLINLAVTINSSILDDTYSGDLVITARSEDQSLITQQTAVSINLQTRTTADAVYRTIMPAVFARYGSSVGPMWTQSMGLTGRAVYGFSSRDASCTTLFAATDNGAYRSTDAGQSWTPVPTFSTQRALAPKVFDGIEAPPAALTPAITVCQANPNIVYLTQWGGGVYRSGDGGATWQPRNAGLGDLWIYALAVHPSNCDVVYVAANERGVWQTTDGGASWSARNSGLGNLATRSIAIAPSNPNRVYVGTTAGIWRTDNGGTTWTATFGLPAAPARSLAVSRTNSDFVVAALDGAGVFITTNAGGSWQERNSGLPDRGARAVALDPRNSQRVVVGLGYGGGVYTSDNGGSAWTAMNEGLGNRNVKALWQAGGACRRLYAGTTNGVWFIEP